MESEAIHVKLATHNEHMETDGDDDHSAMDGSVPHDPDLSPRVHHMPVAKLMQSRCPSVAKNWAIGLLAAALVVMVVVLLVVLETGYTAEPAAHGAIAGLPDGSRELQRLAVGSCAMQTYPHGFWDTIQALDPAIFIMNGDNVYGDYDPDAGWGLGCEDSSCARLRKAYAMLGRKPSFKGFRSAVPLVPIWDDHDLGMNDGGAAFEFKQAAKQAFLDFWKVGADDVRRSRDGLYAHWSFGPAGRRVQIVVLDVRFFKSEFKKRDPAETYDSFGRYVQDSDPEKTMLGGDQWAWLGEVLREPAELRLVVSSLQVMSTGHGWEAWNCMPIERTRLLDMLAAASGSSVILSGDRHMGGLYVQGRVYEMTASSLTHTSNHTGEVDATRVAGPIAVNNIGLVSLDWESRTVLLELRRADKPHAGDAVAHLSFGLDGRRAVGNWTTGQDPAACVNAQAHDWKDPISY